MPESAPVLRRHESCFGGGLDRPAGPKAEAWRESAAAADRLPDPEDIALVEDAASQSTASDVASDRSFPLFLRLLLLLSRQHQQLGIGGQHLADRILELPPRGHAVPDLLDPVLGDVLDMLFPPDHEGQRPDFMASALGAMAGGFATAEMGEGERARKGIAGNLETAQQFELTLPQSRSKRSSRLVNHLIVVIP